MGRSVEDKFWSGFNPGSMSEKHRSRLMADVYGGIKTRQVTTRGRPTRYGYGKSFTQDVPFYDYYNGRGWDEVGKHIGIKNVNSTDEVRRLYDYMHGYKPPAPAPKPAAAPKAAAPKPASNPYKEQSSALLKTIDSLVQSMDKPAPEPPPPPKTIFAGSSNVSNANNLQIAPAAGINKRGGTNNFKRRANSTSSSNLRTIQSVNV